MKKVILFLVLFFLLFSNVFALELDLNSKYAYLYNLSEDKVMYEKSANEEIKVASLTKIMTAIIVIENNQKLDKIVTIMDEDLRDMYEYTTVGFQKGDKVTIEELLYGILLKSGSDAVNAAVRATTKTEEEFVNLMNQKVKELGLTHTYFSNPIGKDEDNYSSVSDIAKIMEYCLKNNEFKKVIMEQSYYIENLDLNVLGPLYNSISKYDVDTSMVSGAKTGFTTMSKHSMVSFSQKNDLVYILVTSYADDYKNLLKDTNTIYNYFYDNYTYINYNINFDIGIENGKTDKYNINIHPKIYLKKDYKQSLLSYKYKGLNNISILQKKGDKIGTVSIYYDKELIKKIDVRLDDDIEYQPKAYLRIILTVFIIFTIIFIFFNRNKIKKVIINKKKKSKPTINVTKKAKNVKNNTENKMNILKNTVDVDLFFTTLNSFNYEIKDREKIECLFIDRCFQNINFESKRELSNLNSSIKLHKNDMCIGTVKYYKKLLKYCLDEYVNK